MTQLAIDLPYHPALGRAPEFALLKGRNNYACRNRLEGGAEDDGQDMLFDPSAVGKLGHDVSSRPRLACGLNKKTILPEALPRNRGGLRSCPRTRRL